jgi:hypothetical protein
MEAIIMTTRKRPAFLRPLTPALLASACLALPPLQAGAASDSYYWTGGLNRSWMEAENWNPAGPPTSESEVWIALPDAVVDFDSNADLFYNALYVSGSVASGTPGAVLNLPDYTLNVAGLTIGLNANESGLLVQTGGALNANAIVLGQDPGSLGTYELREGTLRSAGITVYGEGSGGYGQLFYSGGWLSAPLNNYGYVEFSGVDTRLVVVGDVFNAEGALMKSSSTQVEFMGGFTNAGAYVSDPSNNYFQLLVVTETGHLYGGPGDRFYIMGDFLSSSTQNTKWFTLNSQLIFFGDQTHQFSINGVDLGPNPAGYFDNFAWGDLQLETEVLELQDGNSEPGGALYVGTLFGLEILDGDTIGNISGNGLNIYYAPGANPGLGGKTYALLNGGSLAPVPEPETWALMLAGLGLVGWAARRRG